MDIPIAELLQNLTGIISSGINDWGSIHPIVVHFPLALLFVAPLFVLFGLINQRSSKILYACALVLMLLGSIGIFLATSTGNAAAELLESNPVILGALSAHVQLGEFCRTIFSILSSFFFLYVFFYPTLTKRFNRRINVTIICFFLTAYLTGLIILINAAHYGGMLVHKYNISSTLYSK